MARVSKWGRSGEQGGPSAHGVQVILAPGLWAGFSLWFMGESLQVFEKNGMTLATRTLGCRGGEANERLLQ